MELEKHKEAQAVINNERVQFRQAEYQVLCSIVLCTDTMCRSDNSECVKSENLKSFGWKRTSVSDAKSNA